MKKYLSLLIFFLLLTILFSNVKSSGYGSYPPPTNGDWIITNETLVENVTIVLNGNISIIDGGILTINNVTIIMNSTFDGEFKIIVSYNGSFNVIDSLITSTNPSFGYKFEIYGNMITNRSNINNMWGDIDLGKGGIEIYSDNVILQNSIISNGSVVGIYIYNSSPIIENNYIISNGWRSFQLLYYGYGIKSIGFNRVMILNNTITYNLNTGILLEYDSNASLKFNNISYNQKYGIKVVHSSPSIINNYICYNEYAISCYENHLDYPLNIFKHQILIMNNSIINNGIGIKGENCNIYSLKNNVENNSYSGIFLHWSNSHIISNTVIGSRYSVICELNSYAEIMNTTILSSIDNSISILSSSTIIVINTSFNITKLNISPDTVLLIKNYLTINILLRNGEPIINTTIIIKSDNISIYTLKSDESGQVKDILLPDKVYTNNLLIENITIVTIKNNQYFFNNNPREVDMNTTHTELFIGQKKINNENVFINLIIIVLFIIIFGIFLLYLKKSKKNKQL